MKGATFRQKKEFWNCEKCGVKFERTARKGHRKQFCERCTGNEKYEKRKAEES